MSIETYLLELPHGITLSCRASGARGRPVLVFLHGFPEAAFIWDSLLAHFASEAGGGYRCVAPNLRGFEASSAPADPALYRAKHLVADLAALVAVESPDAPLAALVAHDWGGAVAWNFASEKPALLKKLAIINSPHPQTFLRELRTSEAQRAASAYMNFLVRPDAETLLAEDDFRRLFEFLTGMGAGPDRGEPNRPLGAGWLDEATREQYRDIWRRGLTGGLNYYRASPLRPARENDPAAAGLTLPAEMFTVNVPTLVLWALDDIALMPGLIEGLGAWIPQLTLVPIRQATHWIVHERPTEVAARLDEFLADRPVAGAA